MSVFPRLLAPAARCICFNIWLAHLIAISFDDWPKLIPRVLFYDIVSVFSMINYDALILCNAMLAILSLGWLWHCFEEIKSFLLAITRLRGKLVHNSPPKQSHSAIRFNTELVSSATSKCPILLTALHTFAIVLLRRIWFRIKIFDLCSLLSLFSWPLCLIKGYFSKEKLYAGQN